MTEGKNHDAAQSGTAVADAVTWDDAPLVEEMVAQAAEPRGTPRRQDEESFWAHWRLAIAAVMTWALLILAFALDHFTATPHDVILALYAGAYLAGGTIATRVALIDLRDRKVNVDLLMVTAAIGAAIVNAWAEGAVLLALFATSNALEHHALSRTRRAVEALMDLSPEVATRLGPDGGQRVVPVEELAVGDRILIRPGEKVAADAEVIRGESAVDQAAITGESIPVAKLPGDILFAGTMNTTGALDARVTRLSSESTLAKIVRMVEDAQQEKSRAERFTDAFEGPYAIGIMVISALIAVVPVFFGVQFSTSFYRAMTLLVVASPCALVIATPAATLSALANAARNGILIKGGSYLEDLGGVSVIAVDKTGTLTEGRPVLTDVVPLGHTTERDLLTMVASAEQLSEHPLAAALVAGATDRNLPLQPATEFNSVTGKGITALVAGRRVLAGNEPLFREFGVPVSETAHDRLAALRADGKTAMLVGTASGTADGMADGVAGIVAVADPLRVDAIHAVQEIHKLGITRIVMLSGDNQRVADAIAHRAGIDEARADLLPGDKVAAIAALKREGKVVMVGDGVNDAPALATADLGIAMGGGGSDVALETSDIVLMHDDLTKLPYTIGLSRRARGIIRVNIAFALAVIITMVILTLSIGVPLPLGVVMHEGSTIVVTLNGLRLLAGTHHRPVFKEVAVRQPVPVAG